MINNVTLVGRLTKDPELRYTPSGVATARFTIAVNRTFTNQQGEREADFIQCIAWRKAAENLANYMKKGNLVGVTGRIQTGSFEGQDGKRVYTTDVVTESIQFLEPKGNSGQQGGQQGAQGGQPSPQAIYQQQQQQYQYQQQQQQYQQPYTRVDEDPFANSKGPVEVSEEDLPF